VPLVTLRIAPPSEDPQLAGVTVPIEGIGPGLSVIDVVFIAVQPHWSVTVTVHDPAQRLPWVGEVLVPQLHP
jgi:hypothetical protein